MARRSAGDIALRPDDMGDKVRNLVGPDQRVSVRALAKAWEDMSKVPEAAPLEHAPILKRAPGEDGVDIADDDAPMDLDLEDLDLDDGGAAPDATDDIDLDGDDLDLGGDEPAPAGGEDDIDLDVDDLDLGDEPVEHNRVDASGLEAGDLDLGEDDLDLDADGDASEPAPAATEAPATAATPAPAAATKPAAPPASTAVVKRDDGSVIPVITIPSHALPNNRFLHEPFKVIKVDDGLLGGQKERIWDVDCFLKKFSNLDMAGYKSFSKKVADLFRVEKVLGDQKRLVMYFFDAPHPYDLVFTCVERRNRFFEIAMLLRRSSIMWCPALCPEAEDDAFINVVGTTIVRPSGKIAKVEGDCKFQVARMPYEIIDFWFGCIQMQQRPIPPNHNMLQGWMPKGTHDVYIIGVTDVAGPLMGKPDLGQFFLGYLGQTYHILAQTTITGKDKKAKGNNAIIVLCRRSFIIRMANIEALELETIKREGTAKGDFSAVAACVRLNETTIGCLLVNTTPFLSDPTQRAANIRAYLGNADFGNDALDIGVRFDYLFCAGAFGFNGAFTDKDDLLAQQTVGNFLTEFHEATPDASLAARSALNPMRVFYTCRHNICRFDPKQYLASASMNLNNVCVSGDLYTQRPYLSTFGDQHQKVLFRLMNVQFTGHRVPPFAAPELRMIGEWFEGSPLSAPLVRDGPAYVVQAPGQSPPVLKPVIHAYEYLRLQQISFSILGVLPSTKKKGKIVIASGSFSLKNTFALDEPKEFTVSMVYRACVVGHITGTLSFERDGTA